MRIKIEITFLPPYHQDPGDPTLPYNPNFLDVPMLAGQTKDDAGASGPWGGDATGGRR